MEKYTISQACSLHARIGWQGLTKKEYLNDGDFYLVTGVDFSDGKIDFQHCHYVAQERYEQDEHIQLKPLDVLVTKDGTIGKVAIVESLDKPATLNSGVFVVRPNDPKDLLPEFLVFALRSGHFSRFIEQIKVGCTIAHLNQEKFLKYEIPHISVSQQKHIIAVLSHAEATIKARQQQLQQLDELVKARFVEMFGDCRNNPMHWPVKRLEDVAQVGSSKRVFVEELQETGIPFYRGTEVGTLAEGKPICPELFITEAHYNELCKATGAPQPGDLLMPSICPDGRIWLVDSDAPFYFKDGRVLWVHNIANEYDPVFLLYTLKDRIMTDYLSIASGTTFAELKIFALKQCQVFDVPINKQKQFAEFIRHTDKSKVAVQAALDEAQLLFDSLMQKYFG